MKFGVYFLRENGLAYAEPQSLEKGKASPGRP